MAHPSQFRLSPAYLDLLDGLAAGNGGVRTPALRDAIAYWHAAIAEAGRDNAEVLSPDDWVRLAHLNDPGSVLDTLADYEDGIVVVDWSRRLAHELMGMWEGRVRLPLHEQEYATCRDLAQRIANWGVVRGYALYQALRYFWRHPGCGIGGGEWWHPETWLEPVAREEDQ